MVTAEQLYMEQLDPAAMEREAALSAYVMVRTFLRHNQSLIQGVLPTGSDGQPLGVTYRTEESIEKAVTEAFGGDPHIDTAVKAAYNNHYQQELSTRR